MDPGAGQAHRLFLVGMGPGPAEMMTLRGWELLASGKPLRVREPEHEAAQTALSRGFAFEPSPPAGPEETAASVLSWALGHPESVYAVPGSPLEAPETLPIIHRAGEMGVEVGLVPALGGLDLTPPDPGIGAYGGAEALRAAQAFLRLVAVMARLRGPGGCPWDREQSHASLAKHLIEESAEAVDAIDRGDMVDLEEELGDVLLQVVFHAGIAAESGHFFVGDVIEELLEKLVYRHPHVFEKVEVSGAAEVVHRWEALKEEQRASKGEPGRIPPGLPALLYAHKVQRRTGAEAGLLPDAGQIAGLAAQASGPGAEEAVGELLYQVVLLAQAAGVDPEGALRKRASAVLSAGQPSAQHPA